LSQQIIQQIKYLQIKFGGKQLNDKYSQKLTKADIYIKYKKQKT